MKFVVAQLGARMHYAVPRILWKRHSLERLYTDIASIRMVGRFASVLRSTRLPSVRRLNGRAPEGIPEAAIHHFPIFGLQYRLRSWRAQTPTEKTANHLWAGPQFCRQVAEAGFGRAGGVYVFNSAGREVLERAKEQGLYRVLEQTIAPHRLYERLFREEIAAWPGWEVFSPQDDLADEIIAREESEWPLANEIVCGSRFVAESMEQVMPTAAKCTVVPYGVDRRPVTPRRWKSEEGFNVLFCGRVSLIKGVPYLVAALRKLDSRRIHCRVAGEVFLDAGAARDLGTVAEVVGAVPRSEISQLYDWADVFVLPTLCEGSATVCYEALASGLPVITTPNAGSVVRDGIDGFIIPIRDSHALAGALERLASDRALYESMSRNALERSAEFTLEWYARRLGNALGLDQK